MAIWLVMSGVEIVAADPTIRANLATISQESRATDGAAAGADAIEDYLVRRNSP